MLFMLAGIKERLIDFLNSLIKNPQITKEFNKRNNMEREDIERAADIYANENRNRGNNVKPYSVVDFISGAEWRINSVWHDARTDVPEVYFPVLVEDDLEDFEVSMLALVEECPKNWRRWAYIDDLCLMRRTEL